VGGPRSRHGGDQLVEANPKGHDPHGVGMVPRYIDAMKEGGLGSTSM
jgi:uncharacterized oxidoreductase